MYLKIRNGEKIVFKQSNSLDIEYFRRITNNIPKKFLNTAAFFNIIHVLSILYIGIVIVFLLFLEN
jgi:hypothetical protein